MPNKRSKRSQKAIAGSIAPGPYIQPVTRVERYRLSLFDTLSSDVSGAILQAITIDPTGSNDWTALTGLYGEFRVRGGRFQFAPITAANVNDLGGLVAVAYQNIVASAPTGFSTLLPLATRQMYNAANITHSLPVYNFVVPMVGKDNPIEWLSTSAAFTPTSSLLFATAPLLTVSTNYFFYVLDLFVEFRTRQ